MDQSTGVTEPVVDRFAGLDFGQACEMLFAECKSNAPQSQGFQNMIDYIEKVHVAMGLPFSREEYWNSNVISGSYEVFPTNLGAGLNVIPDDITLEYLDGLIEKLEVLDQANVSYRQTHERAVGEARNGRTLGVIDTRLLTRSMNSAPLFVAMGAEDEDDFI